MSEVEKKDVSVGSDRSQDRNESEDKSTATGSGDRKSVDSVSEIFSMLSKLSIGERERLARMNTASGGSLFPSSNAGVSAFPSTVTYSANVRTPVRRLRQFSWRSPTPSNEASFSTWRILALQYLQDPHVMIGS